MECEWICDGEVVIVADIFQIIRIGIAELELRVTAVYVARVWSKLKHK